MSIKTYVSELSRIHGVTYQRTPIDDFAETASRLVGDNLPPADETEDLLIALHRVGAITSAEGISLLAQHLTSAETSEGSNRNGPNLRAGAHPTKRAQP
jgi:hypothetical protein